MPLTCHAAVLHAACTPLAVETVPAADMRRAVASAAPVTAGRRLVGIFRFSPSLSWGANLDELITARIPLDASHTGLIVCEA